MSRYDDNPSGRYHDDYYDDGPRKYHKEPNWKKLFGITLSVVLALVVAGGVLIYKMGNQLFSLSNYIADSEQASLVTQEELPSEAFDTVDTEKSKGKLLNDDELQQVHDSMSKVDDSVGTITDQEAFSFILVGVDRRDKTWNGNSDSMMLVTINYDKKRVSIISLMRDTYVDIPGVGYAKINNSYARGGGQLLCQTISENYNVQLEKYAAVDFENMIEIVDALDGVDLEMTAEEITVANGYMMDMCDTLGLDGNEYILPIADGTYHCNGVQAVAYARNRYVGNSDYARTERQRYVMSKMIEKISSMSIAQMTSFVTKCLPLVTHNIKESDIWDLVTKAPEIINFDFVQDRVPYDNMYDVIYVDGQDMLVPDWAPTITQMQRTMFGDGETSKNSDNDREEALKLSSEYSADFSARVGMTNAGTRPEDSES